MKRLIAFAALTVFMTVGALMLAGSQFNQAEAGDKGSNCQTITVSPDAAYGITSSREITICR